MLSKNGKIQIKGFFLAAIVCVAYLLLFSASTSPLFPDWYIYDSAIFMKVAKTVVDGGRLFVDVFDHKGPFIFWINATGLILGGRTGVFVLQCIFLFFDILIIQKLSGLFLSDGRKQVLVMALGGVFLSFSLSNGNLTEEYSLPFILLALYFFVKDVLDGGAPRLSHSFFYGIGISYMFFMRMNNAVSIYGMIVCWVFILIRDKRWDLLVKNILSGLLGIISVALPVILIFVVQGSFDEMWYATLVYNLEYSSDVIYVRNFKDLKTFAHIIINFSPIIISMLAIFRFCRMPELKWSFEFISILNILSLFLGQGYNHYFMVYQPLVVLMLSVFFASGGEKGDKVDGVVRCLVVVMCVAYMVLCVRVAFVNIRDYYVSDEIRLENEAVRNGLSGIPEEDRGSVFLYGLPTGYYCLSDIPICYKYEIMYPLWSQTDAAIQDDFKAFMEKSPPKWIVASPYGISGIESYLSDYDEKNGNEYFVIYRKKS